MYARNLTLDGLRDLDHAFVNLMHKFRTVHISMGYKGVTIRFEFQSLLFPSEDGDIDKQAADRYRELAAKCGIRVNPDSLKVEDSGFFVYVDAHYDKGYYRAQV